MKPLLQINMKSEGFRRGINFRNCCKEETRPGLKNGSHRTPSGPSTRNYHPLGIAAESPPKAPLAPRAPKAPIFPQNAHRDPTGPLSQTQRGPWPSKSQWPCCPRRRARRVQLIYKYVPAKFPGLILQVVCGPLGVREFLSCSAA